MEATMRFYWDNGKEDGSYYLGSRVQGLYVVIQGATGFGDEDSGSRISKIQTIRVPFLVGACNWDFRAAGAV